MTGTKAFFSRWGGGDSEPVEPWVTDGTAAGTRLIRDICTGDCRQGPGGWNVNAGKAFFLMQSLSGNFRLQLWRTDGTAQGTFLLTDSSVPEVPTFNPFAGTFTGGKFLYTASESSSGTEPWISDGTPQGTRLVADINLLDIGGSNPHDFQPAGDEVYFLAGDGEHDASALWVSDGTAAGTRFVFALFPDDNPVNPSRIVASAKTDDRFYFMTQVVGADSRLTYTLWSTNGTTAGTAPVLPDDIRVLGYDMAALGHRAFFAAADEVFGQALWVTDGTSTGTRKLANLYVQSPPNLAVFQGRVYFVGCALETGCELWRTDGTPGGTVLVKDIDSRIFTGFAPRLLTEHAGKLYFVARDEGHFHRLWSTDGTTAGTVPVDLTAGPEDIDPAFMVSAGSRFFFWGNTLAASGSPNPDAGLWVSDGTIDGTQRVGYAPITGPGKFAAFNGNVYFENASDLFFLWKSDGTEAGSGALRSNEGKRIRFPTNFKLLAGRLVFTTYIQSSLYESDGTQSGTVKLLPLGVPGSSNSFFELVPAGPRLFFHNWDRDHGTELWTLEAE